MGDLEVDLQGLKTLASTLGSITDRLNDTRNLINGVRDELGDDDVWEALDDFENDWDDGRGQINKNMKAMKEILDESVSVYEQSDDDLATALTENTEDTTKSKTVQR